MVEQGWGFVQGLNSHDVMLGVLLAVSVLI